MIYEIEKALADCGLDAAQTEKVAALLKAERDIDCLEDRLRRVKQKHDAEWKKEQQRFAAEREAIQAKCPHSWQWHGGADESYYRCRACGLEGKPKEQADDAS